jgi:hypothetical protein
MKRTLFVCVLLSLALASFGQVKSDSIQVKKKAGTVFLQNNQNLTPKQLLEITKNNPEAHKLMQKAKTNSDVATVIGFIGGFLVGYPLGTALGGKDPNWSVAGAGAGLIVVSIPFSVGYVKNAKKAVAIYNNGLTKSDLSCVDVNLGLTANGFGLKIRF